MTVETDNALDVFGDVKGVLKLVRQRGDHVVDRVGSVGHRNGLGVVGEQHKLRGVPAKPVDAVVLFPHSKIIEDIIAHFGAAVVGARSPPGAAQIRLAVKINTAVSAGAPSVVLPQTPVVRIVAPMIVHDVHQHRDVPVMAGFDECLELVGRAVGRFDGEGIRKIVPPTRRGGKLADRHQLDGVDTEVDKVVKLLDGVGEFSRQPVEGRRIIKRPDVHFIDNQFVRRRHDKIIRAPGESRRVVNNRIAGARTLELFAVRIAPPQGAVDDKFIRLADSGGGDVARPHPATFGDQRKRSGAPTIKRTCHRHARCVGRPGAKGYPGAAGAGVGRGAPAGTGRLGDGCAGGSKQHHQPEINQSRHNKCYLLMAKPYTRTSASETQNGLA